MSKKPTPPGLVNFWSTLQGLETRLADIAHQFAFGTFNASTKEYVAVLEADPSVPAEEKGNRISWATMGDPKVCPLCEENEGDYEPDDPLLPTMPGHTLCRCWWSVTAP